MRFGAALAALLWIIAGLPAQAARESWSQVWRSEAARHSVSVSGTVRTMTVNGEGELSALARMVGGGGKVRLDYELGQTRWSLIDDGKRLIRLSPERRQALILPRPALALDRKLAERNYQAVVTGETTVVGRPVQVIEIRARKAPPGDHRVVWRLWVDRETGFPLKRERYNVEGKLTSGTEFVEVRFGAAVDRSMFQVPRGWQVVNAENDGGPLTIGQVGRRLGFTVLVPRYLPPGYRFTGCYVGQRGRRGWRMAELRYTDGLRVLSVFQRKREEMRGGGRGHGRGGGGSGRGRSRGRGRGAGNHGGPGFGPPGMEEMTLVDRGSAKALRYLGKERAVVVIGDLPAEELMRVARSVAP